MPLKCCESCGRETSAKDGFCMGCKGEKNHGFWDKECRIGRNLADENSGLEDDCGDDEPRTKNEVRQGKITRNNLI